MVAEMHSETDPEFTPQIHRNRTPSDLKNHDFAWEGHQFSWNPRISKTSPFWLPFRGFWELFGHNFLHFYVTFKGSRTNAEKHWKSIQKVLPGLPQEVPKGSQNPPKIIKNRTLLPNGTPRASEDASGTTRASKMEPRDLKSYHLGPQKWSFHTHFQSCLLSKFKKIP